MTTDTQALASPGRLSLCLCALMLVTGAAPATAQSGLGAIYIENWVNYQKNENGRVQWKYEPRLYVPYRFDNGATFTQRVDVPMLYTNTTGSGNPNGGYSGGIGDIFIEEYYETQEIAPNLHLKGSVRFVFPTGKQSPFGSSQYQWGPAAGLTYAMPDTLQGVTLAPYVRYVSGFAPTYDNVKEKRELNLYPAATFELPERWSFILYPDKPITYNVQKRTWFVPLDVMLARKIDKTFDFGIGGAWKLGNPSDPTYRYIIDARLNVHF